MLRTLIIFVIISERDLKLILIPSILLLCKEELDGASRTNPEGPGFQESESLSFVKEEALMVVKRKKML